MNRKIIFYLLVANLTGCAHTSRKAMSSESLGKNICYEKIYTKEGQIAHVATVDPAFASLKIVKAHGKPSLQKVSALARSHDAIIAINGGFFQANGNPAGALKIAGAWKGKPANNRGLIGWSFTGRTTNFIFDRIIKIDGLMKSVFHPEPWWEDAQNIVGGAPLLIHNGKKIDVKEEKTLEGFLTNRYARTAICLDNNNIIKLVVIDGGDRKSHALGFKSGMSIGELSDFMLSLGCHYALNLDGGYSSAFVKNGKVINSYALSFLPERSVGDAILVIPK